MQPSIRLTERDHALLSRLLQQSPRTAAVLLETLEEELQRATLISVDAAREVVQLGSRVTWEALDSGRVRTARLVAPGQQLDLASELSVLTPIGCALIGMAAGDVFTWVDRGRQWKLRVVAVNNEEVAS